MPAHTPARSFPAPAAARSAMGAPEEAAPAADVEAPPAPPPKPPAVPFREVLRTADTWDVVLMITGTICGAACGAVQPWCGARALPQSFRRRLSGASAAPRRRWPPRVSRRGTLASPAAGCGAAARSGAPRCAVARRTFEALRPTYLCTRPTVPLRPGRPTAARRAMLRDALRVTPPRAPEKATRRAVVTRLPLSLSAPQLHAHLRLPGGHAGLRHHHERKLAPSHPLVLLPRRCVSHTRARFPSATQLTAGLRAPQPLLRWPATWRLRAGRWPASARPTASGACCCARRA